ncbi:MAG: ABC transporter ATP-binding protein [Calditrichaceae bacterium]
MINVKNIFKTYDDKTFALEDVSFNLEQGQIVSVLGHNGAGKSTLLKIIATVLAPTQGEVHFDSICLTKANQNQLRNIKRTIGFLTEDPNLFDNFTPFEYLTYLGQLYGINDDTILKTKINDLFILFNIDKGETKFINKYSSGLKKRIALAGVMINEPKLVILDEPTNNLDPVGVKLFIQLMQNIKSKGTSVILATHQLEIAERISDVIVVIDHGRIIFKGTLSLLENMFNKIKTNKSLENLYTLLVEDEAFVE